MSRTTTQATASRSLATSVGLAVLVVLASLAGVVPVAGASADSASFHEQTVTITRGDAATIGVSHSTRANLTIGSEDAGFEVVVPLGGSGSDKITLNTYQTGGQNGADAFVSGSGATLTTRRLDHAIESGVYEMRVSIDGTTQAVGQLHVEPRRNTVGDAGIAPDDIDIAEASAGDVRSRITDRTTVARGDYVVFSVNESGLGTAFDPENIKGGAGAGGIDAQLVELDPPPNEVTSADDSEEVTVVSHASTAGDDIHVFSQVEQRDRFLVVWDTSDVPLDARSNQTYEFRLSLTSANHLVDDRERLVTKRVRVVEPTVELTAPHGFGLSPWNGTTLRVNGQTNLAPSSEVDVRARQGRPNPQLWKHVREVSANGTFSATFDFAAANRPTSFPVWVLGHRDQSEHTVRLGVANASLSFDDQRVSEGAVTVRRAALSHGGFVRLTANNVPGSAGNTTVGTSTHLGAGVHENVTVVLDTAVDESRNLTAFAVADVDSSGTLNASDAPYETDGTVVADNATILPAADAPQNTTTPPTTSTTPSTTATTTVDVQAEAPLTPVAQDIAGGSSGGVVPLSPLTAVVALAAAALLAGRQ